MRRFRDRVMVATKAGQRYEKLFRKHSEELTRLFGRNKKALGIGRQLLTVAGRMVGDDGKGATVAIGTRDLEEVTAALTQLQAFGSAALKADLVAALGDTRNLAGTTIAGAMERLGERLSCGWP